MSEPLTELRRYLTDWQIEKLADLIGDVVCAGSGDLIIRFQGGKAKYIEMRKSVKFEDNLKKGLDKLE